MGWLAEGNVRVVAVGALRGLALLLLLAGAPSRAPAQQPAAPAPAAPAPAAPAEAAAAEDPAARAEALMAAWRAGADPQAMPVENLALPIDHHANGRPRAVFKAVRALVPQQGYIRASDVTVEQYDEAGRLESVFLAENCIYDKITGCGYCEGRVRIERLGVRITGVGMVWQFHAGSAKILAQAEVRVDRFIKGMGELFK